MLRKVSKMIVVISFFLLLMPLVVYANEVEEIEQTSESSINEKVEMMSEDDMFSEQINLSKFSYENGYIKADDNTEIQLFKIEESSESIENEAYAIDEDTGENTNPNNAYTLLPNTEYTGKISKTNEIRWYAFDISEQTKVSILVTSNDAVNTDIYLFQLDTNSMQLTSTNLSARNNGEEEYFSSVLDSGIYFVAILGVSGIGNYTIDFFENVNFVDSEINDSISNAQTIGSESSFSGGTVTGIIDTMRDVDYYKINVTYAPVLIQVTFSAPGNNSVVWINTDDSSEILGYADNKFILAPGVHYFAVYDSANEFYLSDGIYTVKIDVVTGNLTNDLNATSYIFYPDCKLIMQFYPDKTKYYINGKYINLSCSFSGNIGSNSNNSLFRKWSISLNSGKSLDYSLKGTGVNYQSVLKGKRISRVYQLEIGTINNDIVFGTLFRQQGTSEKTTNITHAVVIIDAFTGTVADIISPDPNPFD